jgi:hypothetical protein
VRYINNEEKHHAKISVEEEWKMFLARHGIKPVDE